MEADELTECLGEHVLIVEEDESEQLFETAHL